MEKFHRRNKTSLAASRGLLVGRRRAWVVVVVAIVVSGFMLAFGGSPAGSAASNLNLPKDAESAQVAELQRQLPSSRTMPAIIVWDRSGTALTDADRQTVAAASEELSSLAVDEQIGDAVPSQDGRTALVIVPLASDLSSDDRNASVEKIRETVKAAAPSGLTAEVTGPAAFGADLGAVFEGADVTLLAATALIVALLLLVTYRSPWLWIVPLSVVAIGDQVAAKSVAVLSRVVDLDLNGGVTGITSVLVFGAGTNYALLLIARYREELRKHEDRHVAMRRAIASAAPAILASSGTVIVALLALGLASAPFTQAIGYAGAVGIAVAVVYALLVLPAAMVLCGRWLFWPFTPRVGQHEPTRTGLWSKVGNAVVARPVPVIGVSLLVLGILASGAFGIRAGLSQTEQFRATPESVTAQETLADSFPAGTASPTVIVSRADQADEVASVAGEVDGVRSARVSDENARIAQIDAILTPDPGSDESFAAIEDLRSAVAEVPGASAMVGGTEASDLDSRDGAARDRLVIIPLILLVVLSVLVILLRSIVAAVLLVLTVVATYGASMGASWFAFERWFGFPALDLGTPLLAFLFLVALGVDYNIFLTTRAREETVEHGVKQGIVTALAVTGGVITSAGILLAAVFTVLGVLPLITLTQLGIIVGFGVLLDTLLVRSLLVPALVSLLGRWFWWPSALSRAADHRGVTRNSLEPQHRD